MSSNEIGIEDARGRLGDLVTAAQQGTDVILTRNGKPAARITLVQPEYLDREEYATLLRDISLYARAMAAFAVAEHANGYQMGPVINEIWMRIRALLNEVSAVPPDEVPDPYADESRGIREVARADAEALSAWPSSRWAD